MASVPNATIVSLAVLKAHYDSGRDHVDNFVPFVSECIRQSASDRIDAEALREDLRHRFGLALPLYAVERVLARARRQGLVSKADDGSGLVPNRAKLQDLDFDKVRTSVLNAHSALVDQLQAYALAAFGQAWTPDETERALTVYLDDNHFDVLAASRQLRLFDPPPQQQRSVKFVVGMFVRDAQERQTLAFKHLETIIIGLMLANAMYLQDPDKATKRFRHTTFYLDTPFLMELLGAEGPPVRDAANELVTNLSTAGARVACFQVTCDEFQRVTQALSSRLRAASAEDLQVRNLRQAGNKASDLALIAGSPDAWLSGQMISVEKLPPFDDHSIVIGEDELRDYIALDGNYTLTGQVQPLIIGA